MLIYFREMSMKSEISVRSYGVFARDRREEMITWKKVF